MDARGRGLVALCVTEITSWGTLYYAFPVLLGPITADTGWSSTATVGAFSAGAVVSAITGVVVGRLLDRFGPRGVMTAGSVLGALGLAAVALAPSLVAFYVAWVVVGAGQAATFYPPAFAAITGWYGPDRLRPLTTVTLVAGFASTVFAPLTAALVGSLSWRETYLVLALVVAVVGVPLHATFLRVPWTAPAVRPGTPDDVARAVIRSPRFLGLAAVMALAGFGLYSATINLVGLLEARGAPLGLAAIGLGLIGAGQVGGRLLYAPLSRRTAPGVRVALVVAVGGALVVLVGVLPGPVGLVIAVAVLAGACRGMHTLLQASVVSDRWGTTSFGRVNGIFTAPTTVAVALAPAGGVLVAELAGGFPAGYVVLGALALVAGAVALGL
ncbi:MFS transporter [Actinomycetospora corticicola]|uniref:MFS family permease n=1 Tax=Actinomycetospora corticicola TaxID=663602 RepID=A0A7Y9DY56_9PSEU|nr:MFS transporter [Actinomycetospora corticicola]NYD37601.1 MFS family permease [Actinomycetospora corticicola]